MSRGFSLGLAIGLSDRDAIELGSCTVLYFQSCFIIGHCHWFFVIFMNQQHSNRHGCVVAYCLYIYSTAVCSCLHSCPDSWLKQEKPLSLAKNSIFNLHDGFSCPPSCPLAGPNSPVFLWRQCKYLSIVVHRGECLSLSVRWMEALLLCNLFAPSPSVHLLSAWHWQLGCINWLLLIVSLLCIISLCSWDQSGVLLRGVCVCQPCVYVCVYPWMSTVFSVQYEAHWI